MGSPPARHGRGDAAAEHEPHGGTDRGSSPQHTQNQAQPPGSDGGDRGTRSGAAPGGAAGATAPLKPKGPTDTGSRIALRNWRISTRLVSLLTLPVVAATTLGGLRINESMSDMEQLEHMQLLTKMTREATALAEALQNERDHAAGPLAHGSDPATDFKVTQPRKVTDQRKEAFLDATSDIGDTTGDDALESIRSNVAQIAQQIHAITEIRQKAYAKGGSPTQTITQYGRLIDSLLSLSQDMAQATSNPDMIKRTRALAAFSSAKEYASIQRAIIAAALPKNATGSITLSENDRQTGQDAAENERQEMESFNAIYASLGGNAEELVAPLETGNSEIEKADKYADRLLRNKGNLTGFERRSYLDWTDQADTKIQAMNTIEETLLGEMESRARELKQESQQDAIINGALILVVLGVSLVGAFVVARSMIRSLRRLQDTATKVAQDRLPELVKQLSESDPQDVDTHVESVGVHSRDEIGQVAAAFDDVHREAVRLAAEQALLRGNVNAMFTNLSRRSQGLIQRQLSLISELESREADPDQLSSLFKLDHLATRMRRNGENLLVLAGEEPGRRWTRPVPLVDVLRAAASEVEQYERIELAAVPATEVAGRVVNDLVHLLAELLENATSFSSPQTKVRVTGHALPDGRVLVEIHDTGIGLSPEDLAAINERLASPPTVDVSVSRRMGLFVVGRLSLRHGIRIQLRPSDSGGTTALVMLPVDVAHGGKKAPGKPGAGAQNGAPQGPAGPGGGRGPAGGPGGPGGAGGPGGGRPGLGGGPSGGPGGASAGMLGAGAPRGQVGAGSAPRAALPGRDGAPYQGGPQQDPSRQAGAPAGAFGADSGRGRPGAQDRQDTPQGGTRGRGRNRQGAPAADDRGRQLPTSGGPRGELPGSGQQGPRAQRPETTSWGSEQPSVPQRSPMDAPRGHEDPESTGQYARPMGAANDRQGPGSTAEFARPDFQGPRPGAQDPAATEQFARPDYNAPRPAPAQQAYGQGAQRQQRDTADYGAPRPPAGSLPPQQQHDALPPANSPGDGRTPLYDTLETNWFHGAHGGQGGQGAPNGYGAGGQQPPAAPQQPGGRPAAAMPPRRPAGQGGQPGQPGQSGQYNASAPAWRTSPNDDLVRQAERARKPSAGGITTSGLPKRVPRANLVPGTAQEQSHQSGPQVSRAPDDVRGRLTNLRRGIQQGRQAGSTGNTGSFNGGPTHRQER
ncbi:nitrate- and nitrite sensing domain-containing protein [Streptomyces sp. FIT100]|uniref:nitrate- and nitrite sensing domain-containing protein n=1 Tax=Streptomyces sp. FIT100 TaxID=2837956 RepID=UPI0021C738D7|nr:nitrate- and nitrite sensing domain-containing protein [Streptomyces sp. FIT100]UUN29354.1 nitrate- and nitrite sensing domain-containing protein [Streptomyces sp. FIT100]